MSKGKKSNTPYNGKALNLWREGGRPKEGMQRRIALPLLSSRASVFRERKEKKKKGKKKNFRKGKREGTTSPAAGTAPKKKE